MKKWKLKVMAFLESIINGLSSMGWEGPSRIK